MTFTSPSMHYLFYANWYCEDQRFCIIIETPETIKMDNGREYLIYYRTPGYPVMCRAGGGRGSKKGRNKTSKNSFNCLTILLKEAKHIATMNPWYSILKHEH